MPRADWSSAPRVQYGLERLRAVAPEAVVRLTPDASIAREGFHLRGTRASGFDIHASEPTGALYACLELAARVDRTDSIELQDAPDFTIRGAAIGMQKTFILPGRKVYEYPYTPELFPFFYDDDHWTKWLDFLVDRRFNALFLWSGHPFSSLLKLADYPFAVEVDAKQLEANERQYRRVAEACDRRGIWLVQKFYSIILPPGFAEHFGCDTQLSAPTPEAADYTRKSVAEFVRRYPNVGLMPCLGEALQGIDHQIQWCNDVILAGIKDGMKAAGLTDEPPVVLRTHATDARKVVPEALRVYRNIFTEAKYNGESLTTWQPRGVRRDLHRAMSQLGSTHLINVHVLANLEPFRYGAQRFIHKCMRAARDEFGARGLHLYPLFFWDWPVSPDATEPRLKQWDRDWNWFEAWSRYAWKIDRDEAEDRAFWIEQYQQRFGMNAGERVLDALNDIGECAPRLLRRFGITEGNRQTLALGMPLDALVNPGRYKPFPELWESQSPPGERLQDYVEREVNGLPHEGETPPQICDEVLAFSAAAIDSIEKASEHVTGDRVEFDRIRNDIHCIAEMSRSYVAKVRAAMSVLHHRLVGEVSELDQAVKQLELSLTHFRKLASLTETTYLYANSMQTAQRRVPFIGGLDGKPVNRHWSEVLPLYENELIDFRTYVEGIKSGRVTAALNESQIGQLPKLFPKSVDGAELFDVQVGSRVFTDRPWQITSLAPELQSQPGLRVSFDQASSGRLAPVTIKLDRPGSVLVGYFQADDAAWLRIPDLETDAIASDWIDVEPALMNVVTIPGAPPVHVHRVNLPAGTHSLDLRNRGAFVILGIVPAETLIAQRDCLRGLAQTGGRP